MSALPLFKGTLSCDLGARRHRLRGTWSQGDSSAAKNERFELIRTLEPDEDPAQLPKDGEFHGSFSFTYVHVIRGKRKERSKVIPECGVNIAFEKMEGHDGGDYKLTGQGTNQLGEFQLDGTATPNYQEGNLTYDVEMWKIYAGPSRNPPNVLS